MEIVSISGLFKLSIEWIPHRSVEDSLIRVIVYKKLDLKEWSCFTVFNLDTKNQWELVRLVCGQVPFDIIKLRKKSRIVLCPTEIAKDNSELRIVIKESDRNIEMYFRFEEFRNGYVNLYTNP